MHRPLNRTSVQPLIMRYENTCFCHKGQKCAAAHRLPVSQKFYNEISARIRSSFASVSPSDALAESAICCVESYLRAGLLPSGAVVESVRLMFALLRPEIDKAMARSAAARRRRRKPQADATVTDGAKMSRHRSRPALLFLSQSGKWQALIMILKNLQIFSKPFHVPLMKPTRRARRRLKMPLRPSCSTAVSAAVRSVFSVVKPAGRRKDNEKHRLCRSIYSRQITIFAVK